MKKKTWKRIGMMNKSIIFLILGLLIASSLVINLDNSKDIEDKIKIEKTRADIIVDINGNGDYTTIQGAIDNATSGDTIYIWAGIYYRNVVINKTLSLIGNSSDNTIIDGGGSGDVVYIDADWVNVTDFNIINSGTNWHDAGIKIYQSNYCIIDNCDITNNEMGFYLDNSYDNHITNNSCSYNDGKGIYLSSSNYNEITNNGCSNNGEDGIALTQSNNNILTDNVCFNNLWGGIALFGSNGNDIMNNTCSENYDNNDEVNEGIYLSASNNNNIINNELSKNGIGIDVVSADNNNILNNNIANNEDYGIEIYNSNSENNLIYHNNFINNNVQAKDDGTNNQWYDGLEGNYWDDWLSPDNNGDGIVDNPYILDGSGGGQDNYPLVDGDYTKPYIDNLLTSPAIKRINDYVNITVEITDGKGIDHVWIDITGMGNFNLSYAGNDIYYYNAKYTNIGTYEFTIWAKDSSNNINSISGSFEIEEKDNSLWLWIGIVVIIVMGVLSGFAYYKKKHKGKQPVAESESQDKDNLPEEEQINE